MANTPAGGHDDPRVLNTEEFESLIGPLRHPDGSPRAGVIYAAPNSAMVSLDGYSFEIYADPAWAAADTGANLIVTITPDLEASLLNRRDRPRASCHRQATAPATLLPCTAATRNPHRYGRP
jgi:hypothetical protein